MNRNGKPATQPLQDLQLPELTKPNKPQPLAKVEQDTKAATDQVALIQQQLNLELQRTMGTVAAFQSAIPIIQAVVGDPNHELQKLTNVILERGCDIAEDVIEITIEDLPTPKPQTK